MEIKLFPNFQIYFNLNNMNNSENSSNSEDKDLFLALKLSKEQEELEIEKDKEEQLIQLAIYNSLLEMNSQNNKINDNNIIINLKEENEEEEKFDENFGICPITQEYMKHPMLTPSGNYYEKSAIIQWINKNKTDPISREILTIDMLVEDIEFRNKIKEYKKKFKKEIEKNNELEIKII